MTTDQGLIAGIIVASMGMFLWGKWRHDMIAMGALLVCVMGGLIPGSEAFAGFGHPAVITVGCVLILSFGMQATGAVDALASRIIPKRAGPSLSILALTAFAALLSGFINNVGALALLMPIALTMATRLDLPPGKVLMPLAFGSILGGTTTLIGTPPNLIVAGFRKNSGMGLFDMFDFFPVGILITLGGIVFLAFLGWRWVPARKGSAGATFETAKYVSEARILQKSPLHRLRIYEVEEALDEFGAQLLAMVRSETRLSVPNPRRRVKAGDPLVIEADPEALGNLLQKLGLDMDAAHAPEGEAKAPETATTDAPAPDPAATEPPPKADLAPAATADTKEPEDEDASLSDGEVLMKEMVAMPNSAFVRRSAAEIRLQARFGVNLLAISRKGHRTIQRLRKERIQPGDVLLLQGSQEGLDSVASDLGCLPLAPRDIPRPDRNQAIRATVIMVFAIGLTAFGVLPVAIAFAAAVLAFLALRIVPQRTVYTLIDWPVIVLLGAMIPVAGAMETTGLAELLAGSLLEHAARGNAVIGLTIILALTMLLTDFMNNAATAALMCPIALSVATQLSVNPDTFLMAVAIGSSSSFLTPIGHQNNTLILGPGGFRFSDYWRVGLVTEIVVLVIAIPSLLLFWPLS